MCFGFARIRGGGILPIVVDGATLAAATPTIVRADLGANTQAPRQMSRRSAGGHVVVR